MAQALFDALSGGPGPGDNQTALAVQSLLESQNVGETSQAEDDDIFQCGRCKKQFTSLPAFVSHKQGRCAPLGTPPLRPANQPAANSVGVAFTTSTPLPSLTNRQQPVVTYSTVPPSPLTQLTQGMVLSDDLMTLNPMEQSLQPVSTVQMQNTTVQANPFLPQVAPPPVPVPCNAQNVTLFGNVNAANQLNTNTNSSIFTSAPMVNNQIPVQNMTQQITMTTCDRICSTDGMKATNAPSGKKVVQNNIITFVPEMDVRVLKSRRAKDPNILNLDDGSNKKKLHCQYCDKSFAKNFDLQQHVRSHTGEKPFQCIVCGRAFAQKSNVKKHMATHKVWPSGMGTTLPRQPSPQPVSSDQDMDTADTPADAEQEVNTHITAQSVPSLVTTASQIELQQLQQLEAKPIESEDLQDPQDHLIQNSSEATLDADGKLNVVVDNSYLCQYCPEKFKSYFQLKSHMVQHKSEQVYKCVVKACGSTFKDLESFLSHTKGHEEDMSYRCHICSKHFATLYELGVHQYSHSNYQSKSLNRNGPRHFQCTKCLNKYSTPEALEHHLSTTSHSYSCPHCKKIFPCERYLRRHLPTHGTIGQFQCLTCQKRFKTEHYLKMHSLIHSGEKPFQCEMCQAAFNRKDKLKRHLLIHETVKKYKCPFRSFTGCTKEFNRPDKLKAHIITHSGIKPFKCKECGKGFSRRPHLVEHERGHRADYKFKCQKCGRGFFRPKLFKEHKCHPLKEGAEPPVFRPRHRRKLGRPRKRMITITPDMLKHSSERDQRRRGRPRGAASRAQQKAAAANSGTTAAVTEGESTVPVEAVPCTAFTCQNAGNPADILTADDLAQVSDTRTALHPQTTPSAVPLQPVDQPLNPGELGSKTSDAVIDHYVVHFTESTDSSGMTIHAQLIPAFPASSVISGTPTLQPITIIEAQPVQVSVPVTDAVSSAPVIVAPAGGAPQHYVPAAASMEEYATTEGHPALQSAAENLLKGPDTVL